MTSAEPQMSFWSELLESPFLWLQLILVGCAVVSSIVARRWGDGAVAATFLCAAFWAYVLATMTFSFGLPLSQLNIPWPAAIDASAQFVEAFLFGRIVRLVWALIAGTWGRGRALARLKALATPLPEGFKFDRDEANERRTSSKRTR